MRISDWSSDVCSSDLWRRGSKSWNGIANTPKYRTKQLIARYSSLAMAVPARPSCLKSCHRTRSFALRVSGKGCSLVLLQKRKARSEEHTSELQSLMRISYAVFCLTKKKIKHTQ